MKEYSLTVKISAENEEDLYERLEDLGENPINSWYEESITENDAKEILGRINIYTDCKGKKTLCEHKNWTELVADGWKFIKPIGTANKVLMTKDGYLNEFWEE